MELLKVEKVRDSKYLKNYEITYKNKIGKEKKYEIVSRNDINSIDEIGSKTAGVCMVVKHKCEDKLLLLREFRMSVNKYIYNMPAGLLDENESVEDCVIRELYEETGLKDISIMKVLKPSFSSVGITDEKVTVVFVEAQGDFEDNSSPNEKIEPKFYSRDEVKNLLETEEFASRTQLICELWLNPFI